MAPITLLLGENSVGKSSIFQLLLAIQQSWREFASIGTFAPNGPCVNLGRFGNVQHRLGEHVYAHTSVMIQEGGGPEIALGWEDPALDRIPETAEDIVAEIPGWPENWRIYGGVADRGCLASVRVGEFRFGATRDDYGRLRLTLGSEATESWLSENPDPVVQKGLHAGAGFVWTIDSADGASFEPVVERVLELDSTEDPDARLRALAEQQELADLLLSEGCTGNWLWTHATRAIERVGKLRKKLLALSHIGGIRDRGKRLYDLQISDAPIHVGSTGDRMVDLLVHHHPEAERRTNTLLESAGIGYRLVLKDPDTQAQVREILLEDVRGGHLDGNLVSLPDVGTGISQMLPIAVQIAVFMDRQNFALDPLLLVEQPELHLHPRLQARLAAMLADAVTLDAERNSHDSLGGAVQFLVETHSEHLVRALGVLVERKKLKPGAVAIIKMTRDHETGEVQGKRIRLDSDGRFRDTWPEGFFPERDRLEDGEIP